MKLSWVLLHKDTAVTVSYSAKGHLMWRGVWINLHGINWSVGPQGTMIYVTERG